MDDDDYKEEIEILSKSIDLTNPESIQPEITEEDLLNNFYKDYQETNIESLLKSLQLLTFKLYHTSIYKNSYFESLNIINILRSLVETNPLPNIKNKALNALTILVYKINSEKNDENSSDYDISEIDNPEFVVSVIGLLNSDYKPAFIFLAQLVLYSKEARDYFLEIFGVDLIMDVVIESTQEHDEDESKEEADEEKKQKNIGYLYFHLLANCCRFPCDEYPKMIEACSEALSSNVSIEYYEDALRALSWIAENGLANEIYSNMNFTSSIEKLFSLENDNLTKLLLKLLLIVNKNIQFQLVLSPNILIPLLRNNNIHILSLAVDLLIQIIINHEGYAEDLANIGILDIFNEILENKPIAYQEILLVLIETMANNFAIPFYGPILPLLVPLLNLQNDKVTERILRLFYRFFTSCDDEASVDQMKQVFADLGGLDLVADFLYEEDLEETAQSILDLFDVSNEDE